MKRVAAGLILGLLIGGAPWLGGVLDRARVRPASSSVRALSRGQGASVPRSRVLSWAEIDAIDEQALARQQQEEAKAKQWADYIAYWQAHAPAPDPAVEALKAQTRIAEAIESASRQAHQDNLSALIWAHSQ